MAIKALVLAVVASLGTACSTAPQVPAGYYAQVRAKRRAAQDAWEAAEIARNRLHPNASPRVRTSCPEHYPTGSSVRVRCPH